MYCALPVSSGNNLSEKMLAGLISSLFLFLRKDTLWVLIQFFIKNAKVDINYYVFSMSSYHIYLYLNEKSPLTPF